ncbi:zwei Ig domain protein zig-8-like isoform X1 [Tigriopus californicus]|uniref:zwei Ig domain protein zig-8-like isoform X1 n=1 Tax=Tigriopus californicus TaxID=6832 RepID=UPI0027DA3F27|nr:zwei Ig domain protein zig-8-like isoform X1 [Tigriopus californicus]
MTSTLASTPGLILLCLLGIPSASLVEQDPQAEDLMESSNFQFSASAAAILPNGFGLTTPPSKPSMSETDLNPRFHLRAMTQNITAIEGREVRLECAVYNLGNKTVSWLRDENLNIISSGRYTYTSDQRFQALHEEDYTHLDRDETLEHWILQIRNAQMEDEGRYECQISTQPITSYHFYLKVVAPATPIRVLGSVPVATILGKPEMFVDVGSTINITCIVQHTPGPPSIVQWQHNGHPIDYTSTRGGVSVLTNKAATTVSSLIIQQARTEDGGTYTCRAGDLVTPSNVKVHVIHGELWDLGRRSGMLSTYIRMYECVLDRFIPPLHPTRNRMSLE